MGETLGSSRREAFDLLQPVAARAVAGFWYTSAGGEGADAPEPNEGDDALAAEVVIAIVDRLPEIASLVAGNEPTLAPGEVVTDIILTIPGDHGLDDPIVVAAAHAFLTHVEAELGVYVLASSEVCSGEAETFYSVRRERDRAVSTLERLQRAHGLYVEGPLRYPGGKDGMHQVVCTCGEWRSPPGDTPRSRIMWDAGRAHAEAKRS